jgi:hypothetical protein
VHPRAFLLFLLADPVHCGIAQGFPNWGETMNKWGQQMIDAVTTVAQMAALGYACLASSDAEHMLTPNHRFDLPQDAFTDIMRDGPHLLAPTGAVYLLTIHGKVVSHE